MTVNAYVGGVGSLWQRGRVFRVKKIKRVNPFNFGHCLYSDKGLGAKNVTSTKGQCTLEIRTTRFSRDKKTIKRVQCGRQ